MGRIFQKTPKKGDPISRAGIAEGLAKIDHALTKMRGEGAIAIDWALGYPRFRFGGSLAAAATNPFWALEIDDDEEEATCSKCWLWITGTTIDMASLTCGLLRQNGYIQAAYTGGNDQLALEYTTSLTVNDPPKIYLPLYQITYKLVDSLPTWEVSSDLRHMPKIGVYL